MGWVLAIVLFLLLLSSKDSDSGKYSSRVQHVPHAKHKPPDFKPKG